MGFEESDLLGGGAAKRHHVLLDVGLQLGAVRWCGQFAIGEDEFGHDLLSVDKEKNNGKAPLSGSRGHLSPSIQIAAMNFLR